MFYIRIDVVQQRLTEHIQVACLHCIVGYIQNKEVNSRLWWPQLDKIRPGQTYYLMQGQIKDTSIQVTA